MPRHYESQMHEDPRDQRRRNSRGGDRTSDRTSDRNNDRGSNPRRPISPEDVASLPRLSGTIKNTNTEKGFGFLVGQDGRDYFFHRSEFAAGEFEQLQRGDAVTFAAAEGSKGPRAHQVTPA